MKSAATHRAGSSRDMPATKSAKRPALKAGRSRRTTAPIRATMPRRSQRSRTADTRAQLIEAAMDVFGRLGFEGASTREIAKAAHANLAAIAYHFGGKQALYIAVAEHIVAAITGSIGPALAAAAVPDALASPEAARSAIHHLVHAFVDVILGTEEAERWARFIVREQMQPSPAFDVIYRFMGGAATVATRLVAAALERPEDAEMRIRVFTLMGQVLVFRVARALVLRRMEWDAIGEKERAAIKRVVLANVDDILAAEQRP
jgi:AcrR family transcriptional regulator